MTPFTESIRYEYDLTPDSVVLDCGGYMGDFADAIWQKYDCEVRVFEPVKQFYEICRDRFKDIPKIRVHNYGLGGSTRKSFFRIKGNMTGSFADDGPTEVIDLVEGSRILPGDLMKLNIEGGEFEVLDNLLETREITKYKNLQIQFHQVIPDCEKRRDAIRERLAETHEEQWCFPWCWESWRIKA